MNTVLCLVAGDTASVCRGEHACASALGRIQINCGWEHSGMAYTIVRAASLQVLPLS